jgi:hypothetical protein
MKFDRNIRQAPLTVVLDLDRIAEHIRERGFRAYVEQTGGGVATIYAGNDTHYLAAAGPGWFSGPNWTKPLAHTSDFSIGLMDEEDGDPVNTGEEPCCTLLYGADEELVVDLICVYLLLGARCQG